MQFHTLFTKTPVVIAMVHVRALPGTNLNKFSPKEITQIALNEALLLKNRGVDAILIENMHDIPYLNRNVGHEISTLMSIIAYEIKRQTNLPIGIQILAGANKSALAAAFSASADFIRAEGFVYGHLADEGYMDSDAGELLRYRKQIGAEKLAIFTDIKKKHSSHAITQDLSIEEIAQAAEFFLSDGLIVTGSSTGKETDINDLISVKEKSNLPVIVGSGVRVDNLEIYFNNADAFIVGSHFKKNGIWSNEIDEKRVSTFMQKVNELRV